MRFLPLRQRRARRARARRPPTAPTIIPTRAPVERPFFECEVTDAPFASDELVGVGVTVMKVVAVGV